MASFNKVYLMGNITRDIELRYTPGGAAVCDMGLAVNRRWTTNGQEQEETTFVDVTVWNKQAENCSRFLKKGSPCFVEGRLRLDSWDDRETGQKRSRLRVVAEHVQFLGSRGDQMPQQGMPQDQAMHQQAVPQAFGQPQQPMAAPYQPPQPPAGGYGGQPAPMPQQQPAAMPQQQVQVAPAAMPQQAAPMTPPAPAPAPMPQAHQVAPQAHVAPAPAQQQPMAAPQQPVAAPQPPPMPENAFNVQDVEDDIPF